MSEEKELILITGAAGFIGSHLTIKLVRLGLNVLAIDSFNPAQKTSLVEIRKDWVKQSVGQSIHQVDLTSNQDLKSLHSMISGNRVTIYHLAAFPGVRESSSRSHEYFINNVTATQNIFELANQITGSRVLFASSSSVYGESANTLGMSEGPIEIKNLKSFYALTKCQNERDAREYSRFNNTKYTALRFFTVYGPYGRPDMAYWNFAQCLLKGTPIPLYGSDGGSRSFTYINDVTDILYRLFSYNQEAKFDVFNIGNPHSELTLDMVRILADNLSDGNYLINNMERPKEDVSATKCNSEKVANLLKFDKYTDMRIGIRQFADWLKNTEFSKV